MKIRYLGLGLFLALSLSSCQGEKLSSSLAQNFILHEGNRYQMSSEADLTALITKLAKDEGFWVENIQYREMKTTEGADFMAITADYLEEEKKTTLLIPLSRQGEGELADYTITCMMACATEIRCQEPLFEIIQPCRELNCGCEIGDGGGSSTVMFY